MKNGLKSIFILIFKNYERKIALSALKLVIQEEIEKKTKEFNENFENEEWLEEHIYPYI